MVRVRFNSLPGKIDFCIELMSGQHKLKSLYMFILSAILRFFIVLNEMYTCFNLSNNFIFINNTGTGKCQKSRLDNKILLGNSITYRLHYLTRHAISQKRSN